MFRTKAFVAFHAYLAGKLFAVWIVALHCLHLRLLYHQTPLPFTCRSNKIDIANSYVEYNTLLFRSQEIEVTKLNRIEIYKRDDMWISMWTNVLNVDKSESDTLHPHFFSDILLKTVSYLPKRQKNVDFVLLVGYHCIRGFV